MDPVSGAGYAVWLYPAQGQLILYRNSAWDINQGLVQLGQAPAKVDTANFHNIGLNFQGSQIQVSYDGSTVITATDSTYATGLVGLEGENKLVTFDNVMVTSPTANTGSLATGSNSLSFSGIYQGPNPAPQTVQVTGSGGTLAWTASSNAPWLSVSPGSGTTSTSLQVSVASSTLTPGNYSGTISVVSLGSINSTQIITVNLTVVRPASGPIVTTVSPANGATSVSTGTSVTVTFNTNTFQLSNNGSKVAATVSYNSSTLTATLVPTQPLAYSTTYTATVASGSNGVQDSNGNPLPSNYIWMFTTAPPTATCPCNIWSPTTTPGTADSGDSNGVELGMKLTSNEAGFITGIRFYKSTANTGTHVGNLWTTGGTLLASVVFTGESASGWQQANFSSPVAVTAGTTYVASYYAPAGHYSFNSAFFSTAGVNNPPLQALANSVSPDGVYSYGSTSAFPAFTYNATNYWVDVVFNTTAR
jgi:hypothetical protein